MQQHNAKQNPRTLVLGSIKGQNIVGIAVGIAALVTVLLVSLAQAKPKEVDTEIIEARLEEAQYAL